MSTTTSKTKVGDGNGEHHHQQRSWYEELGLQSSLFQKRATSDDNINNILNHTSTEPSSSSRSNNKNNSTTCMKIPLTSSEEVEVMAKKKKNNESLEDPDSDYENHEVKNEISYSGVDDDEDFSYLCDIKQVASMERSMFENARSYVKPGRFYHFLTCLYSERKLVVLTMIHFVSTMIIWCNFFLIKFDQQKNKVPDGVNRYWWKRLLPPLEFGAMHAILFQMALIPLTMSRLSIATLACYTSINRFIPFNRSQRIHIHLGYTWSIIVFVATIMFFAFFGLLCSDGEQDFCNKFKSEIMITGYVIFFLCLVIAASSYFRHKIPYELFYAIHHIVFIMYAVTILHTLDGAKGRKDVSSRSQTFRWFSIPILYYLCDRACMHINHRYYARIVQSRLIESSGNNNTRMIILKLRRPSLFQFEPGQYAFLKFGNIDPHWHPFSIASSPGCDFLEFYIEVVGGSDEKSWTNKLWKLFENQNDNDNGGIVNPKSSNEGSRNKGGVHRQSYYLHQNDATGRVEIMGPYGTRIAKTDDYSHAVTIGSGSGIVPILSLYKKHIRQLLRLDPDTYFAEQEGIHKQILKLERAKEQIRGSLVVSCCRGDTSARRKREKQRLNRSIRDMSTYNVNDDSLHVTSSFEPPLMNPKEIKAAAKRASLPIYGMSLLMFAPVFGVLMIGLTISWGNLNFDLYGGMVEVLQIGTILFQLLYALISLGFWDRNSLFTFFDVTILWISFAADWYWFATEKWGRPFAPCDYVYYSLIHGYMTFRLWNSSVKPRYSSTRSDVFRRGGIVALDNLHFVWVTRSATNVATIVPDIIACWNDLVTAWGEENAKKACKISIYVTDKDENACHALRAEILGTSLYKLGDTFHFERPKIQEMLEEHRLDRIDDGNTPTSYSLLAFCGSPQLSAVVSQAKINVDTVTMITGNKYHQMDYVSETYGGYKSRQSSKQTTTSGNDSAEYAYNNTAAASYNMTTIENNNDVASNVDSNSDGSHNSSSGNSTGKTHTSYDNSSITRSDDYFL